MKLLWQLFASFFKMGLFTFGGGLAMLPLIQRVAVEDKKWMTSEEMVDCIAVSQSMPGVIAVNAATYIGNRKKGVAGAAAATIGVVLPSFVIIILAVLFLGAIGDNKYVDGAFAGVKAASCGLILYASYTLGKQILKNVFQWVVAAGAFMAIVVFDINAAWVILSGAIVGFLHFNYQRKKAKKTGEGEDCK